MCLFYAYKSIYVLNTGSQMVLWKDYLLWLLYDHHEVDDVLADDWTINHKYCQ